MGGGTGAFQVLAVKKEREKKAKSSKTEQLSKEEPGRLHPQPHCAVHGVGIRRFLPTQLLPELTVPGTNPTRATSPRMHWELHRTQHDTDTLGVDGACHDAKHRSDRFFPQTHDITLLPRKNTGGQSEIVVSRKLWFWHTNIPFSMCYSLSRGTNPTPQAGGASFRGALPSPCNQSSLELLQLLQFPPLTPH